MSQTLTSKSERFNLRLSADAKEQIERAASFEGKTASNFILSSALAQAEQTLRKHEVMKLSRRDAETFFNALANPPMINAKLTDALKEHSHRIASQ